MLAGAGRYPAFLRIIAFIDEGVGGGAVPNAVHGGQLEVAADFSESVKDLLAERVRHGRIVGPMEGPDWNVLEFRRVFPRRQPAGAWNGRGKPFWIRLDRIPAAKASHGMSQYVDPVGIDRELPRHLIQQ